MTTLYPVRFLVVRPERFTRLQLLIRFVASIALGMVGLTFGGAFMFAFVGLPAYAASRLSSVGPASFRDDDGPRVLRVLHWCIAVSAWAGLTVEHLPGRGPGEMVSLQLERDASFAPTPGAAIARVFTGLPSAFVLMLACCVGALVWLWAALTVLFSERVGRRAPAFLEGLQRWSARLLCYQASLVADYPPFALSDDAPGGAHGA
ncbi:MAG: DUF4389 domain-containing protein [Myxococcota bacterium]